MNQKKRDILSSPRLAELKKRRRRALEKKVLLVLFSFVLVFGLFVFISRLDKLNITNIEVSGNKIIDTEAITEIAQSNLSGYYFYFIPKSNFVLYPKNKIEKELTEKFKRIKNISFDLNKSKTLSISLSEREGSYVWCGEVLPSPETKVEDHNCFFVDNTGYVFDSAPYFSGDVYFKFFGKLSDSYFAPELFAKLISLKESLPSMSLKGSSLSIKDDGDIELYLSSNLTPPLSPKIVFKKDFDLEKTVSNLEASVTSDPLKTDLKNKYASLMYIDLRFGNKVYFKFK
jgi:hypothetical protein